MDKQREENDDGPKRTIFSNFMYIVSDVFVCIWSCSYGYIFYSIIFSAC